MKTHKQFITSEDGIVAIVVTVLIMVVITITTLGMSRIATREQRQVIDRQLNTQAYFAAESGINDMITKINAAIAAGTPITTNIDDCSQTNSIRALPINGHSAQPNELYMDTLLENNLVLSTTAKSEYSCAMAFFDPSSLEYSQITSNPDKSVVADVTASHPAQTIVVGWEDYQSGIRFRQAPNCGVFTPGANWNSAPLLKLDITDLNGTDYSRSDLMNRTASYYLDPCQGTAPYTPVSQTFAPGTSAATNGSILAGNCDAGNVHDRSSPTKPLRCNVTINFTAPGYARGPSGRFMIRLKSVYGTARASILALDSGGNPQHMKGAQTVIDVTGKAGDIVKRTQVRVSSRSPYLYAIESASAICKRLVAVEPPGASLHTMPRVGLPSEDSEVCNPRDDIN